MKNNLFVILALLMLLGACDRESQGNKLSGKEVLVQVRVVGITEGKETDITRSASMKQPERVGTSIDDGMVLEMRMERDSLALRATKSTLSGDSYFRIIAVKAGTDEYVSHDDFTINGGSSGGLHVPDNDDYDFICYSYNNSTALPGLSKSYKRGDNILATETLNVLQSTKDLLWEKVTNVPVYGSAPALAIELERVMARVQVVIDCSYNNWTIAIPGNVTLTTVNTGGTIRLTDKVVASNTGSPTLTWTGSGDKWESNELLVMPKTSGTLTVNIPVNAITRQGLSAIPTSVTTGTFPTALDGGFSYKLLVKLRTPKWAGSNIYWNGNASSGKLTFDLHYPDGDDAPHRGYQGVMFRWGSLVGLSPAGNFTSATIVYVPDNNDIDDNPDTKWRPSTVGAEGYKWWNEEGSIPYVDDVNFSRGGPVNAAYLADRDDTYLIDAARNDPATMYAYHRGDICQYLGTVDDGLAGYRMAISYETAGTMPYYTISGGQTPNDWGTANFPGNKYRRNTSMGDAIFPFSGARTDSQTMSGGGGGGNMAYAGTYGYYWVGSTADDVNAHRWWTNSTGWGADPVPRSNGLTVRCVVAD